MAASGWSLAQTHATPTVEVRARAAVERLTAECKGARCTLVGRLRDDLGRGVAGAEVLLAEPPRRARTDADGRFRIELDGLADGAHSWRLRFDGSRLLGPAEAQVAGRSGRQPVSLSASLPTPAEAGRPLALRVRAESVAPLADATFLRWRVDGGAEAALALDANDEAQTLIPGLAPGRHPLEITYAGDGTHLPATLSQIISVVQPVKVTLSARWHPQGPTLAGRVSPVSAPAPVLLTVDGQALQRALTGADGTFALRLGPRQLAAGEHVLRALVAGDEAEGRAPGASESVTLTVPALAPEPVPDHRWWLLGPAALALLGLGAALRRRHQPPPRPRALPPPSPPPAPVEVLVPPAPDGGCVVVLVSALSGEALAGEWAGAAHPSTDRFVRPADVKTAPDSSVRLNDPPAWLWAEAAGHGPVCVALPAGARIEVRLWPLAAVVQHAFEDCLARAGLPRLSFGRETPRQAAAALRIRGAPESVEALADAVARACFGAQPPTRPQTEDLVARCAALALRSYPRAEAPTRIEIFV